MLSIVAMITVLMILLALLVMWVALLMLRRFLSGGLTEEQMYDNKRRSQ